MFLLFSIKLHLRGCSHDLSPGNRANGPGHVTAPTCYVYWRASDHMITTRTESTLLCSARGPRKPSLQRTAFFLETILPTNCVLASLRQDARSALRSAVMQGSTFTA